ncbi:MAG: hypothetical protein DYH08_07690 [Actinobacteria bacterium ATB1]|nr:hypothetical protein [Actinobacteria bacterium ATB1]
MTAPEKIPSARPIERRYPLGKGIRVGIVAAIVAATALAAVVAYAIASLDCRYTAVDDCVAAAATVAQKAACESVACSSSSPIVWSLVGALIGLVGSAVVAVLVARSFGEWQMMRNGRREVGGGGPATC